MLAESFSPGPALLGGATIGVAVSMFLYATGKVAGISGIVGGLLQPARGDVAWRVAFIAGLLVTGVVAWFAAPEAVAFDLERPAWLIAAAGLLVGFGTRLGNGCTSGHGVCGVSRLSPRSIVSTLTFVGAGMAVTTALRAATGGV